MHLYEAELADWFSQRFYAQYNPSLEDNLLVEIAKLVDFRSVEQVYAEYHHQQGKEDKPDCPVDDGTGTAAIFEPNSVQEG